MLLTISRMAILSQRHNDIGLSELYRRQSRCSLLYEIYKSVVEPTLVICWSTNSSSFPSSYLKRFLCSTMTKDDKNNKLLLVRLWLFSSSEIMQIQQAGLYRTTPGKWIAHSQPGYFLYFRYTFILCSRLFHFTYTFSVVFFYITASLCITVSTFCGSSSSDALCWSIPWI